MTSISASPVSVDFHGTAIPTFNVEGIVRVAMRPICDAIGLQWESQYNRIKRHPVLASTISMMNMVAADGKRRKLLTLPLNKLNGWLFGIDTNRVKPEVRERLVEYQSECFDVLADYWQKGEAVNPRASTIGERRPLNRAVRTLANLRSARGEAADYAGMWRLVNGYLGVAHIDEATEPQIEQAMAYVQDAIELETRRVIEGDWMGRETLPATDTVTLDYPLTRPWNEWQEHQLIGGDAMYHSDIRRLMKQLIDASRNGATVKVENIENIRAEFRALTNLCEMQGIKARKCQSQLDHVRNHAQSLARSVGGIDAALER